MLNSIILLYRTCSEYFPKFNFEKLRFLNFVICCLVIYDLTTFQEIQNNNRKFKKLLINNKFFILS